MESKTIELVTENIPENDADFTFLQNAYNQLTNLYEKIGRIYVKRKELEVEFENVDNALGQAEEDFKALNDSVRVVISKLEKRYPKGQIDIKAGTITYSK